MCYPLRLFLVFCFLFLPAGVGSLQAVTTLSGDYHIEAQGSETGHLLLDGGLSIGGNAMDFGTTGASDSALAWTYTESGTVYTLSLAATRASTAFLWQDNAGGTAKTKMKLGSDNSLVLQAPNYTSGSGGQIILTPATGGSQITVDGNALLTQTTAASTYLTPAAANSAYLRKDAAQMAIGSSNTASGSHSFAFGDSNTASGDYSIAIGQYSLASGSFSTALGYFTNTLGNCSAAFGFCTTAGGSASVAFGDYTATDGSCSAAFGSSTYAAGFCSVVMGSYTKSYSYASVALGQNNVGFSSSAGETQWIGTDPVLEIGNGDGETPSNALTVLKNANARIGGVLDVKEGVRVPPKGDLSMGSFTAGLNPADLDPETGLRYTSELPP